jgi:DnaJ homolog subfamily A member 2
MHGSDTVKVVRGQGMPSYRHHDFGNLYIQFDVKFPERLGGPDGASMSPEAVAALESVLPQRSVPETIPGDAMIEDYVLEEVDPSQQARGMGITDEDDDDMHGGQHGVQCATQ